jgi:hypothetical protein
MCMRKKIVQDGVMMSIRTQAYQFRSESFKHKEFHSLQEIEDPVIQQPRSLILRI